MIASDRFHRTAAAAALAVCLAACGPGAAPGGAADGDTTAAPSPAPAPEARTPPAVADTVPPDPTAWPDRAVLEEHSLAVDTYGPDDPAACDLPPVLPGDGSGTVLVFHGCTPDAGPALDAVPARRVAVGGSDDKMEAAVRAQLAGATPEERRAGFTSNFGPGTAATPFTVRRMDGGLVVLDLAPSIRGQPMAFVSNAEARQLVAALGQFDGVERVTILIGGRPLCDALGMC